MPVPNNTPATAIEITEAELPKTITLDMSDLDSNGAWYKFSIPARMYLVGLRATNSAYLDKIQPYSDAGITPTNIYCDYTHLVQVTVEPGGTYYFNMLPTGTPPVGSNASFTLTGCPTDYATQGDILITDDLDDDGESAGVILDPSNGDIVRSVDISPGEAGDRLSGLLLFDYRANLGDSSKLKLYNNYYDLIAEITSPYPTNAIPFIRSDQEDLFYFYQVNSSNTYVYTVDRLGNLTLLLTFNAESFNSFCPDIGSNILYYADVNTNQPVKRWDLVNNMALSNFVAGVVNHRVAEIAVLPDGNIAIVYTSSVDSSGYVEVYNAAGVSQGSYNPAFDGTTWRFDHICRTFSNGEYWIRVLNVDAVTSKFERVRVSDSSILQTFTVTMFDGGISEDNTTAQNFGPSSSCTLLVVETEIVLAPLSGIYYLLDPADLNANQRRHDTLYTAYDPVATEEVAIPNIFAETGLIGDE